MKSRPSSPPSPSYSPPPSPGLTTEKIRLWDKTKAMEFLKRMEVPQDDVISISVQTWPTHNGQPEMEFDGKTLLQLDREHVLDDMTLLLEEPMRMWDVIRQAQDWAWRNDGILERRAGEVESMSARPIEVVEDGDPVIIKTGRKRPVYQVRDDEDRRVVDLSDDEDEEGEANSPIVIEDQPRGVSGDGKLASGHDVTDLTVSLDDEMDDLYDA
jgi:hypothetical protein